jgi:beta-lactamase superfamily II metal-dependent hydrolase
MTDQHDDSVPIARVWFMNVGNGDCTVVLDELTRSALVVDCPSLYVDSVRSLLEHERANLHTCIVTHWDVDHYAGVSRLAVALPVTRVMYNHDTLFASDDSPPHAVRGALKNFLNIPNAPQVLAPASVGTGGAFGHVSWKMLAPTHHELTKAYVSGRRNVASGVVEVSIPSLRILIGGDAVAGTWQRLISEDLRADILRWPHHGADLAGDSSGITVDLVMKVVQPTYTVVSAGSLNSYGHPSSGVIGNVRDRSSVLCTQVTAGCFGYISRAERNSQAARDLVEGLNSSHCAGTVEVQCFEQSYRVTPDSATHQSRVSRWPRPMCSSGKIEQRADVLVDLAPNAAPEKLS